MKTNDWRFTAALAALLVVCATPFRKYASADPAAAKKTDASSTEKADAPVSVEYLGLTADGERFRYRVHVNTAKTISQVDVSVAYADAAGRRQTQTVIWQNIVHSKRQPIENGKSYEDDSYLGPNTKNVSVALRRIVYADGTAWSASR